MRLKRYFSQKRDLLMSPVRSVSQIVWNDGAKCPSCTNFSGDYIILSAIIISPFP